MDSNNGLVGVRIKVDSDKEMGDTEDVDFNFSQKSSNVLDITPEHRIMCEIDSVSNSCLNGQTQVENNVVDKTLLNSGKFKLDLESPDRTNLENMSVKYQNLNVMLEEHEYEMIVDEHLVEEFPDAEEAAVSVNEQNYYNLQLKS